MNSLLEKAKLLFIPTVIFTFITVAYAHNGVDDEHGPEQNISSEEVRQVKLEKINEEYKEKVRPIFQNNCFDCHSQKTRYPWYYKLPIAKQIIDKDISDALPHLDLTNDFPFKGHGTPEKDFKAIEESINNGSMPPLRHRIMHRGSGLNEDELKSVMKWIEDSRKMLE